MPVMWKQWRSHETKTGPAPAPHKARNTGQMYRYMQDTLSRRHNCDCYPECLAASSNPCTQHAHTAVLTDGTHSSCHKSTHSLHQAAYLFQYNPATAAAAAAHKTACQAPHTTRCKGTRRWNQAIQRDDARGGEAACCIALWRQVKSRCDTCTRCGHLPTDSVKGAVVYSASASQHSRIQTRDHPVRLKDTHTHTNTHGAAPLVAPGPAGGQAGTHAKTHSGAHTHPPHT